MEAVEIRLLSSGCGTSQQGPELRPAALLIHHKLLRQGTAALTGHQQLTNSSAFVLYMYIMQYVVCNWCFELK